ncbi:RICIN domain-containing protein [Lentzea alba]|uniref:hypothetical protein n=1 Tax=Lentzea alba TaxID=2714351 RepID=UPI0039BFE494
MSLVLASALLFAAASPCADEVVIRSAAVDSVIEAADHLRQVAPSGSAAQRWVRTTSGGLRNVHTGQCMSGSGNYVLLRDCSASDPSQRWKFLPVAGGVMLTTEAAAEGAVLAGSRSVPNSIYGLFEPTAGDPIYRWII